MIRSYIIATLAGLLAALVLLQPHGSELIVLWGPRLCLFTITAVLPRNAVALANVLFLSLTCVAIGVRPGILRLSFVSSVLGFFGRIEFFASPLCLLPFTWLLWLGFSGLSHAGVQAKGMFLDLAAVWLGELVRAATANSRRPISQKELDPAIEILPFLLAPVLALAYLLIEPLGDWYQSNILLQFSADSKPLLTFVLCAISGLALWGTTLLLLRCLRGLFDACAMSLLPSARKGFIDDHGTVMLPSISAPSQLACGDGLSLIKRRFSEAIQEGQDLTYRVRQLKRSARELSQVMKDMPHEALLLNGDGVIVFLSPSLKNLLGVQVEEPQGTSFLTLKNSRSEFAEEFVDILEKTFSDIRDGAVAEFREANTKVREGVALKLLLTVSNTYHAEIDRETVMVSVFVNREREKKDFAVSLLRPQIAEIFGVLEIPERGERKDAIEKIFLEHEKSQSLNLLRELEILLEQVKANLRLDFSPQIFMQEPAKGEAISHHARYSIRVKPGIFGGLMRYFMSLLYQTLPQKGTELRLENVELGSGTGTFIQGAYPGSFIKLSLIFPSENTSDDFAKVVADPLFLGTSDNEFQTQAILALLSYQVKRVEGFLGTRRHDDLRRLLEIFLPAAPRPARVIEDSTPLDLFGDSEANALYLGQDAAVAEEMGRKLQALGYQLVFRNIDEAIQKNLPPLPEFDGSGFEALKGEKEEKPRRTRTFSWSGNRFELLIFELSRLDPETEALIELFKKLGRKESRFLLIPEVLEAKFSSECGLDKDEFQILHKPLDYTQFIQSVPPRSAEADPEIKEEPEADTLSHSELEA